MIRILIVYGTTHGQTAKIANAVSQALRSRAATVDVVPAGRATCRPHGYDAVIVAASVHAGTYQKPVRRWVRSHAAELNRKPTAFVSVSLGVLQQDPKVQRELRAIVDRFTTEAGWSPVVVKQVAGALLYRQYNWFIRRIMKRIAAKAGGETDTTRDYEYTDWKDLCSFAELFFVRVAAETHAPTAIGA